VFNVLVIIGATAIVIRKNKKIKRWPIARDLVFYSLTILLLLFTFWDGMITFYETIIFVAAYILYIFIVANWSKRWKYSDEEIPDIEA